MGSVRVSVMGKRLLITGGAGFVGSSLALQFREAYPDWHIISLII